MWDCNGVRVHLTEVKFEQGLENAKSVHLADTWNRGTDSPDEGMASAKATIGERTRNKT